jgi:hypothetical protein
VPYKRKKESVQIQVDINRRAARLGQLAMCAAFGSAICKSYIAGKSAISGKRSRRTARLRHRNGSRRRIRNVREAEQCYEGLRSRIRNALKVRRISSCFVVRAIVQDQALFAAGKGPARCAPYCSSVPAATRLPIGKIRKIEKYPLTSILSVDGVSAKSRSKVHAS